MKTRPCPRCGVPIEVKAGRSNGRCEDCQSLGWRERPHFIKAELAKQLASPCDCGKSTWAECVDCQRIAQLFNDRRARTQRKAAA